MTTTILEIFQKLGLHKPCVVRLKDDNYYTKPSVEALQLDANGDCWVDDFAVGHHKYGEAIFPGRTNVAKLKLDAIGKNTFDPDFNNMASCVK